MMLIVISKNGSKLLLIVKGLSLLHVKSRASSVPEISSHPWSFLDLSPHTWFHAGLEWLLLLSPSLKLRHVLFGSLEYLQVFQSA